jgi:hypothetical protein
MFLPQPDNPSFLRFGRYSHCYRYCFGCCGSQLVNLFLLERIFHSPDVFNLKTNDNKDAIYYNKQLETGKSQCQIYVNNTDKGKKIAIPKMPTFKKQQQIENLLPGLKISIHC